MIRIVNLRNYTLKENEILYKVDRSNKILGNWFFMHNEKERDIVCDKYQKWFDIAITNKNERVLNELRKIYKLAKIQDVALGCWCYPKRCHSETILKFLQQYLKEVK